MARNRSRDPGPVRAPSNAGEVGWYALIAAARPGLQLQAGRSVCLVAAGTATDTVRRVRRAPYGRRTSGKLCDVAQNLTLRNLRFSDKDLSSGLQHRGLKPEGRFGSAKLWQLPLRRRLPCHCEQRLRISRSLMPRLRHCPRQGASQDREELLSRVFQEDADGQARQSCGQ